MGRITKFLTKKRVIKTIISYLIRYSILLWFFVMAYKETGLYTIVLFILLFLIVELRDIADRLTNKRIDMIQETNNKRDELLDLLVNIIRIQTSKEDMKERNKHPYNVN